MLSKLKYVDLFAGAGGFSLGFVETGLYKPILAVDNFKPAALTYKTNIPEAIVLVEDLKELDSQAIRDILGEPDVELVIGSPPCEPFTGANPRREKNPVDRLYIDPQGQLTLHFIRLVGVLKPKVFVMENVPAIMEDGLREALVREFRRAGYDTIYFNILNAEDYSSPSRRRRVFVSNIRINPPKSGKRVRVIDAIGDMPPPGGSLPNHDPPPELSWRKLKKAARLKYGEALVYFQGSTREIPNLIKLDPYDTAPTVLGSSRFIHPFENRLLTVREQARLMGFPDNFVFYGGRDDQYNMIGEAVPVPLARAIAEYVYKAAREL
ncbi:DNA cytosine methyltransferase [Thermogladius sp. 4427co]|uniref:DNA cytosine methyltransferase n=1 Tax=Thermogladius sp. 4427co TaxID=3450718 RepID=UPI003F79168B